MFNYIGLGSRGRTPLQRAVVALLSVLVFAYIVGAAMCHHPLSWLG